MKGMYCGKRAVLATFLLVGAFAVAPAIAQADIVGSVSSAVPSTSTAPAASSVPAVAAVTSSPAPATPAPSTDPVALATPVASASVSANHIHAQSGPAVVSAVGTLTAAAKAAASKAVNATPVTKGAVAKLKKTHAALAKKTNLKYTVHVNTPTRVLTWTSDDPQMGCRAGGNWQICIPLTSFGPTQNQCNGESVTLQGSGAIWIRVVTNPVNGTVTIFQRQFFTGITSLAPGSQGNDYFGKDQQNDVNKTFALGGFKDDNREFEELIVTQHNSLTPAPSMFLSTHTVFGMDAFGHVTVDVSKTRLVCKRGDIADDDPDQGDHKQCDRHHNREDFHGYNDDSNGWNEQE